MPKYKILKKNGIILAQSLDDSDAKEIIFSLIKDSFGVVPCTISAIDSEDALSQFEMKESMGL